MEKEKILDIFKRIFDYYNLKYSITEDKVIFYRGGMLKIDIFLFDKKIKVDGEDIEIYDLSNVINIIYTNIFSICEINKIFARNIKFDENCEQTIKVEFRNIKFKKIIENVHR